jgi:aminoglycoside phosphotransferase (APT) family kinase protein
MDLCSLLRWASDTNGVPSLRCVNPIQCSATASRFAHGQSNPTFLVSVSFLARINFTPDPVQFVLRCRPHGTLLPSAHRLDREYLIYSALAKTSVPAPAVLGSYCRDTGVIGVEFFAMEYVQGRIYTDVSLDGVSAVERAEIYQEMVRVLTCIAAVDTRAVGLAALSRSTPLPWTRRQLTMWTSQFRTSKLPCGDYKDMETLVDALERVCEADSAETPAGLQSLVHGDFRLDNCIFGRQAGRLRVLAVIDWELAALGDPLADLATFCTPYFLESSIVKQRPELSTIIMARPIPEGIPPSEKNILAMYASATSCSYRAIVRRMPFLTALALFRFASISYGVAARARAGNASSRSAHLVGETVPIMFVRAALGILEGSSAAEIPCAIDDNLEHRVARFLHSEVMPLEASYAAHIMSDLRWASWPPMEVMKSKAKDANLWNLWIPKAVGGKLSAVAYAPLAELMGRCVYASEVFNCSAPDTGNMELVGFVT